MNPADPLHTKLQLSAAPTWSVGAVLIGRSRRDDLGVFEPAAPRVIDVAEFDRDDPDLLAALALHNLGLE